MAYLIEQGGRKSPSPHVGYSGVRGEEEAEDMKEYRGGEWGNGRRRAAGCDKS